MDIALIPAFADNYIFYGQTQSGLGFVVDPGDAAPVMAYLEKNSLPLDAILITHHHHDHTGGLLDLKEKYDCEVYGPATDTHRIQGIDVPLTEGDTVHLNGVTFTVYETPGHTSGHICYYSEGIEILFCGDTLFSLGCGRLFEGTPAQMFASLAKLQALPDATRVYCAHEYTLSNLAFAKAYRDTVDYSEIEDQLADMRAKQKPTIPSTIGFERAWNPFLNCDKLETFAKMRAAKDSF
ncbi:MAG: hydroxyacylglutathione hydrolase [Pseudobdellovibrionaceae bacterium]